ncbi:hypothetical protein QR680_015229 [Steinernema hermaphroditum]|uniref:Uncharacterized protein n=1 Tax=Steinernema hermaphroditum TaxID=289476 RepID=A0AA39LJV8_9BILA|nr:hypothetical protein QR680_015229 [Steinernema hermaphroditum]
MIAVQFVINMSPRKKGLLLRLLCFLVLVAILTELFLLSSSSLKQRTISRRTVKKFINRTTSSASYKPIGCTLPRADPWDPSIAKFLDPKWIQCEPKKALLTSMQDGKIVLSEEGRARGYHCQARTLVPYGDWNYTTSNWEDIGSFVSNEDMAEVKCGRTRSNPMEYNFIHTQIVERPDNANYGSYPREQPSLPSQITTSDEERPNIYIILTDSTSTSAFVRSMQRTLHLMREQHEAVLFPFLNKVGLNSRPNAWAFMMGRQFQEIASNPYMDEHLPDIQRNESCDTYVDDLNFWLYKFRDMGYHTMMYDDYAMGTLGWPHCKGFERTPAKHFISDMAIRYRAKDGHVKRTMDTFCRESYEDQLEILQAFINSYRNESQFAFMWNSFLAHDELNGLYHFDGPLFNFLNANKERLEKSFVILMGDHGLRFGPQRESQVGDLEDNNPLFLMSVPLKYRRSALMNTLKENSQKLISHYDIYASFLHLAKLIKDGELEASTDENAELFKVGYGSSFFSPNMMEPRDCGTLRIPYEYCLCEKKFDAIDASSELGRSLETLAFDYMTDQIDQAGASALCYEMKVIPDRTIVENLWLPDEREVYRVTITVSPSYGRFAGYIIVHRSGGELEFEMMSKRFDRVNSYGNEGDCVQHLEEIMPMCFCKTWGNWLGGWLRSFVL